MIKFPSVKTGLASALLIFIGPLILCFRWHFETCGHDISPTIVYYFSAILYFVHFKHLTFYFQIKKCRMINWICSSSERTDRSCKNSILLEGADSCPSRKSLELLHWLSNRYCAKCLCVSVFTLKKKYSCMNGISVLWSCDIEITRVNRQL